MILSSHFRPVGGLLPVANGEKNGLMSTNEYLKVSQYISSNKLVQIISNDGYSALLFIRTSAATGLYCANGNWSNYSSLTKLSGPLDGSHFKAYRGKDGGVYIKSMNGSLEVSSIGSNKNFKFVESDIDVSTLIEL